MANIEKKSSDPEIDYQYPDEKIDSEVNFDLPEDRPAARKGSPLSRLPKRKVILWVVISLVLFAVYQALTPKDEEAARVPQTQATNEKQKKQVTKTTLETKKSAPSVQTQPTINLVPTSAEAVNTTQMAQFQEQLQNISTEVADLKEALSALIPTLEVMAGQVQALRQAQQSRPSTFRPFTPKVPYFLTAVISGRAWLASGDGHLITVKEGDKLPEYGTITKIDHNEGWVDTSSGLVISYGKNDS